MTFSLRMPCLSFAIASPPRRKRERSPALRHIQAPMIDARPRPCTTVHELGDGGMTGHKPRGIAVVDLGATTVKAALFDGEGRLVAERKTKATHRPPPPY